MTLRGVTETTGILRDIMRDRGFMLQKYLRYQFLFEELVKRDFKKKYKRTVLGMAWSLLSPLLMLLVMKLVFTQFFGRNMAHYTTYLFCGNPGVLLLQRVHLAGHAVPDEQRGHLHQGQCAQVSVPVL